MLRQPRIIVLLLATALIWSVGSPLASARPAVIYRNGASGHRPLHIHTVPPTTAPTTTTLPPVAAVPSAPVVPSSAYQACVIYRESRGNPTAVNASGASGLYQFMPETWASVTAQMGFDGGAGLPGEAADYSANIQTQVFWFLYDELGSAPWASDGC